MDVGKISEPTVMSDVNLVAVLLLTLELYHAYSHGCILFRKRMLPQKDLVRVKQYFLVDLLTVTSSALYTRQVLWLAALQNLQHMYFYFNWNKSSYCIRVIEWSSLDWVVQPSSNQSKSTTEKANRLDRVDVLLGTLFDLVVHVVYAYYLSFYLTWVGALMSFALLYALSILVLHNKRFSWANPDQVPTWVERRLSNISTKKG